MESVTSAMDHLSSSGTMLPVLAIAAVAIVALAFVVVLLRAERSLANVSLSIIALVAVAGVAVFAMRGADGSRSSPSMAQGVSGVPLAALSCLDDMAGETVLNACERILFSSPDTVAAAVSYAGSRINLLLASGEVQSPQTAALRRAVERDRFGFVAHVLSTRDGCKPDACDAFRVLTDRSRINANLQARVYDEHVNEYAAQWSGPLARPATTMVPDTIALPPSVAGLPASVPTGRPTNAEFPSSDSIPPVNIMTDSPVAVGTSKNGNAERNANAERPVPSPAPRKAQAPRPRPPATEAPMQLAPAGSSR